MSLILNKFKITTRICLVMLIHFCIVATAVAAPALPDSANLPRIETQPNPPVIISPKIENNEDLQYPAALPDTPGIKVNVSKLEFTGNKNIGDETLSLILKEYLNKPLDIKALNQMTALVTRYYRQQGFMLAQAYLPEQDINQYALEIAVVEGYLGEIKLKVSSGLDEGFFKRVSSRNLTKGEAIQESNLVRNVTLINSLPGLNATSQLNPGQQVGYSDVEIDVQALPRVNGVLSANTYGNRFTGREVLSAGLSLNNLAGRGDRLNVNLRTSNGEGQRGLQLGYVLPVYDAGNLLYLSAGYADYQLSGQFSSLGAEGDSYYLSALLDQPILRSRQGNATSRLGLSYKNISDDISAFSLKDHRSISAIELGLFGDWRDAKWSGFNQVGVNLKLADVSFKNDLAEILDDTGARTAGNFVKYNVFASRLQPISEAYSIRLSGEWQGANKNLDSSEKLSIGGVNRWREYGELPSSSDRGLIVGTELRRAMLPVAALARFLPALQSVEVSPYVFFDYGRGIISHSALSTDNHVRSSHYGIGIDTLIAKRWALDFTVSHQKRLTEGAATETETRAWGQLQMEF
jgi:hemolysin activation/secretion protein